MVLNCGGREVIRVSRDSFITSQRSVDTVVGTYLEIEPISLIPVDIKVHVDPIPIYVNKTNPHIAVP